MARRTATSYRGRSTRTAPAETPEAAPGEDKGLDLVESITIATTVLLFVAILLTDAFLGRRFDAGLFF